MKKKAMTPDGIRVSLFSHTRLFPHADWGNWLRRFLCLDFFPPIIVGRILYTL